MVQVHLLPGVRHRPSPAPVRSSPPRSRRIWPAITLVALALSAPGQAQWITGFYQSQNGVEPISALPWGKYTHIVHFAITTDGSGGILPQQLTPAEISQLIAARPAGKKIMVCIQDNSNNLSAFRTSTAPGNIDRFVANIGAFVSSNGYDGVDLDWEQNLSAGQYANLFQLLRAAMPTAVITTDMNNNSAAVAAAAASASFVDQFNLTCYDLDNPGNGYSWYNDPLFQNGNNSVQTCNWRVEPFLKAGVPTTKIGIGLPFYGRRWQGVTSVLASVNTTGVTFSTVLYNYLVSDSTRWQPQYQFYDRTYRSDYLSIPPLNEFDSYTGVREIQDVAAWIRARHFGGAMTYSLHYEYLGGQSGDAQYPLSTALYDALFFPRSGRTTPPHKSH